MSGHPPRIGVLLTGCCGFIGGWSTLACLRAGYRVRGTSVDPDRARHLFDRALAAEPDGAALARHLEIVPAELLDAGAWNGLADGCAAVVHIACPVRTEIGTPPEAMLQPAVQGTEHVMREAARAGAVTRVIYMSSIVTLLDHHRPAPRGAAPETVGPADWNETATPAADPYADAKVRAERRARALVAESMPGALIASVLPGPVIGPPLPGAALPASVDKTLGPLLTGQLARGSVDLSLGLVDVRDVAAVVARLLAVDPARLAALGDGARFVCVAPPTTPLQALADAVRTHAPAYAPVLPKRRLPLPRALLLAAMRLTVSREAHGYARAMLGRRVTYDTTLTEQALAMRWRPVAESVADTLAWIDAHGLYPPPRRAQAVA